MRSSRVRASALCVCVWVALGVAGCGSDNGQATPEAVPADAVAVVAKTPITRQSFEDRLAARLRGISPLSGHSRAGTVLDPPGFQACVKDLRREFKETKQLTRAQLLENCRFQYRVERRATLTQLIEEQWFIQWARDEGIGLDGQEIERRLRLYESSLGPTAAAGKRRFNQLLTRSGMTRSDAALELAGELAKQAFSAETTDDGPTSADPASALQDDWRSRTLCSENLVVPQCANGG